MRRVVACLSVALLLPACTGEDSPGQSVRETPTAPVPVATAKPKVTVPSGPAPEDLVTTDLTVGTGAAVIPGQNVSVHYVGVRFSDGSEFDTSWDGSAFTFTLGGGDVITGWDKGILGMRIGGRRRLVIPPHMGYGGDPTHELARETLVFVVDVLGAGGHPAQVGDPQQTS